MLVLLRHNLSDTSAARAYHMDIVHGRVMYQNLQKRITNRMHPVPVLVVSIPMPWCSIHKPPISVSTKCRYVWAL